MTEEQKVEWVACSLGFHVAPPEICERVLWLIRAGFNCYGAMYRMREFLDLPT